MASHETWLLPPSNRFGTFTNIVMAVLSRFLHPKRKRNRERKTTQRYRRELLLRQQGLTSSTQQHSQTTTSTAKTRAIFLCDVHGDGDIPEIPLAPTPVADYKLRGKRSLAVRAIGGLEHMPSRNAPPRKC